VVASGRGSGPGEVLNLCFHGIGTPERTLEPDEELYWVEPAQFKEFLTVIVRYPTVRITFDDGNRSDIALALPALLKHNLKATFFVISSRLGQPGSLAPAEVRSLVRSDMTIGSHGMWHRSWRSASDKELHEELAGAAEAIADAAGQTVREAACPFGAYDRRVLSAARHHGFSRVYTVDGGPAKSDAWLQSRYTIRASDTPADLERRARFPRGKPFPAAVAKGKSLIKQWR
jgi:peptidoglycan/xylan/chitin deacetylase (PgdA/CDA1 family)